MRPSARLLCLLAGCVALSWGQAVQADELWGRGDLICSPKSDLALVRFALIYNDDPTVFVRLPATNDEGLSAAKPTKQTDCRLPGGRRVRLRMGEGQAFAYGMGGADPPYFFSLWIDGHKILSRRTWKPGYGAEGPIMVGLAVRQTALEFCYRNNETSPIWCSHEPLDLAAHPVDRIEYPTNGRTRPPVGALIAGRGAADPAFCRRVIARLGKQFDDLVSGASGGAFDAKLPLEKVPGEPSNFVGTAVLVLGPGFPPKRVTAFMNASHAFDGDIYVIAPPSTPIADVLALNRNGRQIDEEALKPAPPGWTIVSGGRRDLYPGASSRYVHFSPIRFEERVYLFAYPTNNQETPTAVLVALKPAGGYSSTCAIRRVEPHF